ncbi:2-keto-4-pentenoate hydratase/2-oxohepta-3-ene-1,7-dioic acid hydratase in catechol pathway [Paenibacillus taihuensis]|uniref:2-keto-4-pentenoate hydratase/2-oxohepta-3-ene-1,7-dioic acid hydratase in catechol pathway n=1 Tax=Paenibacillus taihuensis TaxID=1156355 RepID=A0A3D9RQ84_9BACL|nr:fumarylacetoacetate hydrolase family protein [Paenibacillus taihuensis]REE78903.1 2-keto-4-pentenoate hydratase/2-oxohepta-3-ene-1,7-dioic acid hydratase in catechol pathway [Paenibacillus taihuensis]
MKLVSISKQGRNALGVAAANGIIIDIEEALQAVKAEQEVPTTVTAVIEGGDAALAALRSYVDALPVDGGAAYVRGESDIEWGPCVTEPNKIICVGLNYRKHAEETNAPIPEYPILFNKFNNTLTGNLKDIAVPKVTEKLDYEAELVIVIGKKTKYVAKEDALSHVFGYCAVNDLSARDLQLRTHQWLLGKTCDDFSPLGPYLVTADEVGNPNDLWIKSTVNGEVRQSSNTSDMIFHCDEIVSYVSQHMTLVPGDIILTGTPEGVVLGLPPEQQVYLKPGDEVTIEIEKLGALTNRFVADQG